MVDKLCNYLTKKIRNKMPEVDDERAEVINYGLHLLLGEIPKNFIILGVAYLLGILWLTFITLLIIIPYRFVSGGVHLKTHIGCLIGTSMFYIGTAYVSTLVVFSEVYIKYIFVAFVWVFSMFMIKLYAPADTEEVPILRKKEREIKKILSYIAMTITLIISFFIQDTIMQNIMMFATLAQTIMITRFVYKITNSKYGHEEYYKNKQEENLIGNL